MAGYSAPGLLDGDYGYNSFWDNMSVGDMHELTLAPQHGDAGLVSALRIREQQGGGNDAREGCGAGGGSSKVARLFISVGCSC